MQVGIALHHGEIAYGNVGSGARLDFTVIGRDVALATRIAGMNAKLGEPLLLSASFERRMSRPAERIGRYAARGFPEPVEVFRPAPADGARGGTGSIP
jgi:adenylate cyclase